MNVLILAPHPDDDVLGVGGTTRKHVLAGDKVHIVYLTSGDKGGDPKVREAETGLASQVLQTHYMYYWKEPDGALSLTNQNVNDLHRLLMNVPFSRMYSPHPSDSHPDHRVAASIAREAMSRPLTALVELWYYEVWTPLQTFNQIVDITPYVSEKRAAIRAHKSQLQNDFEGAILALNHYRGIMHGPNKMYAEVFQKA